MDKMPLQEDIEKKQQEQDAENLYENFYNRKRTLEDTQSENPSDVIDRTYSPQELQDKLGIRTLWSDAPFVRGFNYEKLKGANIGGNFPVIDDFRGDTGKATSYKTLDLSNETYSENPDKPQNLSSLENKLKDYTDRLESFNGRTWDGVEVPEGAIKEKVLCVGIPRGEATEGQMAVLESCKKYALSKNVNLIFEEVS